MKKRIFIIMFSVFSLFSFGQITVTDANLINIGNVIYQSEDTTTNINLGYSGYQNQTWDFSSLQNMDSWVMHAISPSGTPFSQLYPNANICLEDDGEFIYCNKSTTGVQMLGLGDSVLQQSIMLVPLPLTYGTSFTDGPILALDSLIGGPMVNALLSSQGLSALMLTMGQAHVADSLSLQGIITTYFEADADGNITIPMGNYDAVRLRVDRVFNYDISVYCTDTINGVNSGWYPLTFFAEQETESAYQWYSPDANFILIEVAIDSLGNQDGEVIFLSNNLSSNNTHMADNLLDVYPVPSTNNITIDYPNGENVDAVLTDINGRKIMRFEFTDSKMIDLSSLNDGTYLNLTTNKRSVVKKVIIE